MMRYYIPWPDAYYAMFEDLTNEEYGCLVRAAQKYAMTGQVRPVIGAAAQYLPAVLEQVDHYAEKCEEQRKRCSAAGKKGGRPRKKPKSNNKLNEHNKHKANSNANAEREGKSGAPPSLVEVEEFCRANGLQINAALFHSYYQARGWKLNGQPIDDWKATVQTWALRERGTPSPAPEQTVTTAPDAAEVERMRRLREQLRRDKEGDSTE